MPSCRVEKNEIVTKCRKGQSVTLLCSEYDVPRSTIYHWIKQHKVLESTANRTVFYKEYLDLKRHAENLEVQLEILKKVNCNISSPLKEKLAEMDELYGQYSVHSLCRALDVSRGTFYNHIFRKKDVTAYDRHREEVRAAVQIVFDESKQRFGAKKICAVLSERGINTSPNYVSDLMQEMGLSSVGRNSKKEYKRQMANTKKQNHLQRQFNVAQPNRVWVSDITTYKFKDQYYYICVIIDLFSRKIIACRVSSNCSTYLVTSTFKLAFDERGCPQDLMFHSDRGVQYTSVAFQNLLRMNNIVQSFSKTGSPHDNAVAESFFSSLKKEELYRTNYRSEREFYESVYEYVGFYNCKRPHKTLKYLTPEQYEDKHKSK